MATASLQAFRRVTTVAWPQHIQTNARALLVRVAKQGHAKIMAAAASNGLYPTWEAYANTPGNSNIDNVVLPGPIVYLYHYVTDVAEFALTELQKNSPVRSGRYAKSHTIYLNGQPVARAPKMLKRGDEILITNPVPYARRLEIGKTESGRDFVIQVPPRIYERTAKKLKAKYGKVVKITFTYVNVPNAHVITGGLPLHYVGKGGVRRRRRQQVGSTITAPAIIIEPLN